MPINGANDAPTDIQLTSTAVIENSLKQPLDRLPPQMLIQAVTFTVSSDDDGGLFEISGTTLKLKDTVKADKMLNQVIP